MGNIYKNLSSMVYDFTKRPGTSIDGDLEFYLQRIIPINGIVLEAGVGNGRMLIPFLRRGIKIDGIDISDEMLSICKKNCLEYNLEANLYQGDLRTFDFDKNYNAIIVPNGTVCLVGDIFEIKKMLLNFYNNLIKNGIIIIDLIYPTSFKSGTTNENIINYDENIIKINQYSKSIDWIEQSTLTEFKYSLISNGEILEEEVQIFKLYWFGINEFKNILIEVGFIDIEIIINYGVKKILNLKNVTFMAKKR